MQIFIKSHSKIHSIEINNDDTIYELKQIIFSITGIPDRNQYLIFMCKGVYNDDNFVSDYLLYDGCTVDVNLRICGGMKKKDIIG